MKDNLLLILKGFLIGLGKIIPGVSGAMMAISMGLYEKGIESLTTFWRKDSFLFLFKCGIGFLFALIFGSKFIMIIYNKYYFYTLSVFIGMMMCSILGMKEKIKMFHKNILLSLIICFLFCFILFIHKENNYVFTFQIKDYFFLIWVGFVEAFSMMFPGVSGTSLMMMMGVYTFIMTEISNLLSIQYFWYHISIFFPFFIGIFIGVLIFTNILHKMFIYHNETMNYLIFGFILSSVFFLIQKLVFYHPNLYEIFFGLLFFIFGMLLSYFFDD